MQPTALHRLGHPGLEQSQLPLAADEAELEPGLAARGTLERAVQRPDLDRVGLALELEVRKALPDEGLARSLADGAGHVDPLPRGRGHQPSGEVDGVAQAHERAAHLVAVGAAAQAALAHPDLDLAGRGGLLEVTQLEGRGRRPGRVVLVRQWRPEHAVEVGALVAQRELEDVAPVAVEDPLRRPDEVVQLLDRLVVVVVVDAAEAQEYGNGRPELRQELAAAGPHPLVDGGQQPRPHEVLGERCGLVAGLGLHVDEQARGGPRRCGR